jgi:signal transduction histidine kinase
VPIRARLVLGGVGVTALALLVFGLLADRLVAHGAPRDQDRKLAALAERAVGSVLRASPQSLRAGVSPTAESVDSSTEPFVAILDERGKVLYASARFDTITQSLFSDATRSGAAPSTIRSGGGTDLRLAVRPWRRPGLRLAGVVVAGQATRFATKQISDFRGFLVVSGVIAAIAAALATWVVSGRTLKPLRRLAATADEIGRTGDLRRRLPDARSRDVMALLTASFNGMLDRIAAAHRRLEESLEAQRRFVADASHELRNPLTTIRSNADFLLERGEATAPDRAEALADIAGEGKRMSRIVDDLLTLARSDDAQPPERHPVDLAALLRDVGRGVQLDLRGSPVPFGDPDALRRLIAILLDNAASHGSGAIELGLATENGFAVVTVSDRGPGIGEADLERLFERFYQADPARQRAGAGLGRSIARSIANAHGGSIRAANRPGGGAVFTVELPLER